jgi:hypothetical protein
MSSKHYAAQINALMHGGNSIGTFTLPKNIELVTFNKPEFNLNVLHVIKIFDVLRNIPKSKRIRSQILKSEVLDLYDEYGLNYGEYIDQIKSNNIRVTVYKPQSSNIPDLIHYIHDTTNIKKIIGFYNTNEAKITYKKNTKEFIPESGFLKESLNDFIKDFLGNNINREFTTKQLIENISIGANTKYPGKVLRIFLFSCRDDKDKSENDEDMAEKFLKNISSETISPEIAEQPLLTQEVIGKIMSKRKRNSPKIKITKNKNSYKKTLKKKKSSLSL